MTPSGAVRIWWDDSVGAYRVVTPYNAGFVQFIKDNVPVSDRVWDPSTKIWTIAERFFTAVKLTAEATFRATAQVVTKEQAQRATAPTAIAKAPLDSVIVQFFKLLPQEAAAKAYREAAARLHPDHGGSMDKMSSLNALWSRLKEDMWKAS